MAPMAIDGFEVFGLEELASVKAAQVAFSMINEKLPAQALGLLEGITITLGDNLTESGAETDAENGTVLLDKNKNSLSLQAAENYLVSEGYLDIGDWVAALPEQKDNPWSCLTYQLIHEICHVIDGRSEGNKYNRLEASKSPTKYGHKNSSEAFAEALTYWICGLPLDPEVAKTVQSVIGKNWGEL